MVDVKFVRWGYNSEEQKFEAILDSPASEDVTFQCAVSSDESRDWVECNFSMVECLVSVDVPVAPAPGQWVACQMMEDGQRVTGGSVRVRGNGGRRLKLLTIDPDLFLDMLREDKLAGDAIAIVKDRVPKSAVVIAVNLNRCIEVLVHDESFDVVPHGDEVPRLCPEFQVCRE